MNDLERLEKVIQLGKKISRFSELDRNTFIFYLNKWISRGFDKNEFELLMAKYQIKYRFIVPDDIKQLLKDREVLRLLLTAILHPN